MLIYISKMEISKKIEWAVRWWAIGDAMWLPVEIRTSKKIMEELWWINEYLPVGKNWFLKKYEKESWS
jgi:ADP-ribosylglycohydrolase